MGAGGAQTLNSFVLTMWRLSGHHLLAANLENAQISTECHMCGRNASPGRSFFDAARPRWVCNTPHLYSSARLHCTENVPAGQLQSNPLAFTPLVQRQEQHITHWLSALHSHDVTASMHTNEATTRRLATARTLSFMSTHEAIYLIRMNAECQNKMKARVVERTFHQGRIADSPHI